MQRHNVLVIEDDPDILELIKYNLEKNGFNVCTAMNGEDGIAKAQENLPEIILLDIMLPTIDGLEVCKNLRQSETTIKIPIIMLTAKGEESDIVIGLELGADDYVTKPFSPNELVARIKAILRRNKIHKQMTPNNTITIGPLLIKKDRHEVSLNGNSLTLTLSEFNLLEALCSKPGRVFTREQLLDKIAGDNTYLIDRNIDVHIRGLRKKLGEDKDLIQTVRGIGYKCKG